jgi:hypothetical protein
MFQITININSINQNIFLLLLRFYRPVELVLGIATAHLTQWSFQTIDNPVNFYQVKLQLFSLVRFD